MIVYPAIDIIDGKCVRLSRGDYSNKTVYSDNLESVVSSWLSKGTRFLHGRSRWSKSWKTNEY